MFHLFIHDHFQFVWRNRYFTEIPEVKYNKWTFTTFVGIYFSPMWWKVCKRCSFCINRWRFWPYSYFLLIEHFPNRPFQKLICPPIYMRAIGDYFCFAFHVQILFNCWIESKIFTASLMNAIICDFIACKKKKEAIKPKETPRNQ